MYISQLTLRQFRNINDAQLTFSPHHNVILGNNGQGKTNVLEALVLLSQARSHRASTDRQLIQHEQTFARVVADVNAKAQALPVQIEVLVSITADDRARTVFKRCDQPVKSRSQILGILPSVSFFVSDLLLLRGTPEDRRRWLDSAVIQYNRKHFTALAEYQRVRQQKNRLLKDADAQGMSQSSLYEQLALWNEALASAGAKVTAYRLQYLAQVAALAPVAYRDLLDSASSSGEWLELAYQSQWVPEALSAFALPDAETLESQLHEALKEGLVRRFNDEIRRGTALVGPHRDDIGFTLSGQDAVDFGSQGQQRSIVLALKLSEIALLNDVLLEHPILLLDDVMAELDPQRQQLLFSAIRADTQVFLTTTHLNDSMNQYVSPVDTRIFTVDRGVIQPKQTMSMPVEAV
jgi:DNA replication and repair protein RecF